MVDAARDPGSSVVHAARKLGAQFLLMLLTLLADAITIRTVTGIPLVTNHHILRFKTMLLETIAAANVPFVSRWEGTNPVVCIPSLNMETKVSRLLADGDSNAKLAKNTGRGFLTCGLSISPARQSGIGNVCTDASEACINACLDETGMGAIFKTIKAARIAKNVLYYRERQWFYDRFDAELTRWENKAERKGLNLACRPNVFSDIAWELSGIIENHPNCQFYDYTKHAKRFGVLLPNYWVTFSRSETNEQTALKILSQGGNVAIVFHNPGKFSGNRSGKQTLPETWEGFEVINGDETDLRFTDPRGGKVIGLKLKSASNDKRDAAIASGFSVEHKPS